MAWLDASELRIGLGCMRLPEDERPALAVIAAAADAGVTVFDTARAYGADAGGNERLVARGLKAARRDTRARVVTKGGMTRVGAEWIPDGRAKTIAADCEASLEALDGLPIDLYLLHAPDPRTPWRTSVRALGRLVDQGLVRRVGVANVTRPQLDEALELAPIAAVQVALNPFDDRALRGGVVDRCAEDGVAVMAHSPLGGPRRGPGLGRRPVLAEAAERLGVSPAEVVLAWLLGVAPAVVAIPGARRPDAARSAARAATLELAPEDTAVLDKAFGGALRAVGRAARKAGGGPAGSAPARPGVGAREVVLLMGIPGAGKTRLAASYLERGYARLNRDERGGSLRALAVELDEQLAAGVSRIIVDGTYLTRAARSYVVEAAERHAVPARCVWLDTPLAQAQVNLVERLLDRFDRLPTPEEIRAAGRREPWLMVPTSQMRALRELEPPSSEEGFAGVDRVAFTRVRERGGAPADGGTAGVLVGAAAAGTPGLADVLAGAAPEAPHLLFDWSPGGDTSALRAEAARIAASVRGPVEIAVCPHPAGPPACWCRPPLPGLPLAFARAHALDPRRLIVIGASAAHETLARTLESRYVFVGAPVP